MRPIRRGESPQSTDYANYKDAKMELVSHIGSGWIKNRHIASYCSYCERNIATNLAVEHIEPKKGEFAQPQLKGSWTNFLLACVNCNSTKGSKQVQFDKLFFPDRDNTFYAFEYLDDGSVIPSRQLNLQDSHIAQASLALVGLDKQLRESYDSEGYLIAQDRASQRMEIWGIAESALDDYLKAPISAVKKSILKIMVLSGFFSVWMTVFEDQQEMKILFIDALKGTKESGCFDSTGEAISPPPNDDELLFGSKA